MAAKATCLVGLDVHARQTHAAVLDLGSGELAVRRLAGAPEEVVPFLAGLPGPVVAVYEAGPTGFGLAREAKRSDLEVRVIAPGIDPEGARRSGQDRPSRRGPPRAAAGCWRAAVRVRADGRG